MGRPYTLSFFLFLFLLGLCACESYRILAIFPHNGKSHTGVLHRITKSLAAKGHQVDVVSHFPLRSPPPNYTDVVTLPSVGKPATMDFELFISEKLFLQENVDVMTKMCKHLELPDMSKLVRDQLKNPKYNVLLIHYLFGDNCFTGIGHLLNLPVIGIVTTTLAVHMNNFVGNPLNLGLPPCKYCSSANAKMTFWERLKNVYSTHAEIYNFHKRMKVQQHFINKYFGHDVPHYTELEKSISLMLTNSHFSYTGIKPKVPAVVEIGGIHIDVDRSDPMEPGFKKILDDSKDGFILFSFGSMVKIETFPEELLEKFRRTFENLSPIRVIMRIAKPEELTKNWPSNVYMYTWLPQQQMFQHPNIKSFVTHGGAHSIQEAIYHGIPMVCIPFYFDQHQNCDLLAGKNLAIKLNFQTARQKDYDNAFRQILSDPIYRESIRNTSALFRDRPRSPTEEALYWIEFVTRHGKNALRSPSVDLDWWQVENVDVYSAIITSVLITVISVMYLVYKISRILILRIKFGVVKDGCNDRKLK